MVLIFFAITLSISAVFGACESTKKIPPTSPDTSGTAFAELVPALVQCFGVIILGYIAGRFELLTDSQAKGLSSYVTKFALPAVFFRVMVTLDFSGICWMFVLAVSISKLVAFVTAMFFTFILSRRVHLGIAAIVAMFVSQSNDVALAYPILKSLYPDLACYIYLFAPAQLVVLNPFAYFLLEWHHSEILGTKRVLLVRRSHHQCHRILQVLWNVLKNPLFFMTVIGVIFNFILGHQLPVYVDGLLKIIAESFSATALFSLGFGMVGKMHSITQREIYILVTILLTKLIVLPFLTREMVVQLMPAHFSNETLRYSTFAFLYGSTPTAPPVYLFASEYDVIPVAIGVGLVLGTFLSGPLMFVLSQIVTIYMAKTSAYDLLLGDIVFGVCWISIACCIWTFCIQFAGAKAFRVPNRFTLCHLIFVLVSCSGVLFGHYLTARSKSALMSDHLSSMAIDGKQWSGYLAMSPANVFNYLQFAIFFCGCTGTRCWTTLIALSLYLERSRSLCFVLRHQIWIFLVGFTTPFFITGLLLVSTPIQQINEIHPIYLYGKNQLIVSLFVLLLNTFGTICLIIGYVRLDNRHIDYMEICGSDDGRLESSILSETSTSSRRPTSQNTFLEFAEEPLSPVTSLRASSSESHLTLLNSDPVIDQMEREKEQNQGLNKLNYLAVQRACHSGHFCGHCNSEKQKECSRLLRDYDGVASNENFNYGTSLAENSPSRANPRPQSSNLSMAPHHRHLTLLLLLLITMFFGICLCTWRLVHEDPSGVYLALEFLDGIFNFGQGVLLFIVFGLDADFIILPVKRFVAYARRFLGSVLESSSQL